MALITRFSRLFTADLHAVMDRLEEPESIIKQSIREMEESLADMRLEATAFSHDLERLQKLWRDSNKRIEELDVELNDCFESGDEHLIKDLIRRKLESQRRSDAIFEKRSNLESSFNSLQTGISENERHLAGMQQKLDLLVAERPSIGENNITSSDHSISDEEVEIAFIREKQKRVQS